MVDPDYHKYPPVGRCIYCGTADGKLSTEHIVPFSLNGKWLLPDASCEDCQKVTQKIEEVCTAKQWGMFFPLRSRFKIQSRSRSTKSGKLSAEIVNPDGSRTVTDFSSDGFPAVVYGIKLPLAGIMRVEEPRGDEPIKREKQTLVFRTWPHSDEFSRQATGHDPKALVKLGSFRPSAMLLLVAKIGYSFAAAEIGTKPLMPLLADFILGKANVGTYLIGAGLEDDGQEMDYLHRLEMREATIGENKFSLAMVHLFGQLGMPKYHVVVGHRTNN